MIYFSRKITVILYHEPRWDEDSYKHDVALFRLATPIPSYTDIIMPICMPDHFIKDRIIPELELKVSGFGDTGKLSYCSIIYCIN